VSAAIFAEPGQRECRHVVITGDGQQVPWEVYTCTLHAGHEPAGDHHCGDAVEMGRPGNWRCPNFCDGRTDHYADTHGVVMTP
jgi:hypothetical protein